MGASNFHNVNASRIFAVTGLEESWEWDDMKDGLSSHIAELHNVWVNKIYFQYKSGIGVDPSKLPSYESTILGTLSATRGYQNYDVTVSLVVVVRSGYYEGCNFDYIVGYDVQGQEFEMLDDCIYAIMDASGLTKKQANFRAEQIKPWIEKAQAVLVRELENLFEQHCTSKLVRIGGFSDGTSIYQEV